jgi:hypothetical protein
LQKVIAQKFDRSCVEPLYMAKAALLAQKSASSISDNSAHNVNPEQVKEEDVGLLGKFMERVGATKG